MRLFSPPVRDSLFVLDEVLEVTGYAHLPSFAEFDRDLLEAVLSEAARFCAEVIAPLNAVSDTEGCIRHKDGSVTTPTGFREAYRRYVEGGWGTLALPAEWGGQGILRVEACDRPLLCAANTT